MAENKPKTEELNAAIERAHQITAVRIERQPALEFLNQVAVLTGLAPVLTLEQFPWFRGTVVEYCKLCGLICTPETIRNLKKAKLIDVPPHSGGNRFGEWFPEHVAGLVASLISRKRFMMFHPTWSLLKSTWDIQAEMWAAGLRSPNVEEVVQLPLGVIVDAIENARNDYERAAAVSALRAKLHHLGIPRGDDGQLLPYQLPEDVVNDMVPEATEKVAQ